MSWPIREHAIFKDLVEFRSGFLRRILDLQFQSLCLAEKTLLAEFDFSEIKVLDFGAGGQDFKRRHRVVHYESCDPQGESLWQDLGQIPQDKRYDLIVATEVFEHLPNPLEILNRLSQHQSVGQKIYISTPFLAREHGAPDDFQRWTAQGLEKLLAEGGYTMDVCIKRGHLLAVISASLNYIFFRGLFSKYFPAVLLLTPLVLVLLFVSHATLGRFRQTSHYLGLSVLATKIQSKDL